MTEVITLGEDGKRVESRTISQSDLTSECWAVQIWGLDICENCPVKDTEECGGPNIRKTGKNAKGHKVPVGVANEM